MSEISVRSLLNEVGLPESKVPENCAVADKVVTSISLDSRHVLPGAIFFALEGSEGHGRRYLKEAFVRGAVVAFVEEKCEDWKIEVNQNRVLIFAPDTRYVLYKSASLIYNVYLKNYLSVGVTGTNGKTSVTWMLTDCLSRIGFDACCAGTLGLFSLRAFCSDECGLEIEDTINTTPDIVKLFAYLGKQKHGDSKRALLVEMSSHALHQRRLPVIPWDIAVFTNLSRDHLDYHESMADYSDSKAGLFLKELRFSEKPEKWAVLNIDEELGQKLAEKLRLFDSVSLITYSQEDKGIADIGLLNAETTLEGTHLELVVYGEECKIFVPMIGRHNIENILAVVGVLVAAGHSAGRIVDILKDVSLPPGRLERFSKGGKNAFVDYAHTPAALETVQLALRSVCKGRLITVFGCGGDRDKGKRMLMGQAVDKYSDIAVITSDNPRYENPSEIISDILPAFKNEAESIVLEDRKQAISYAINLASKDDVLLIAGKGHEEYQEIKGVKHRYSDIECVKEILGLEG